MKKLVLSILLLSTLHVNAQLDWTQTGQDIDGEAAADLSGEEVSMSADGLTVAIGARFNTGNGSQAGHVRVYQFNGSSWVQLGADIDAETPGDRCGEEVSISADGLTVAVGAPRNDGNGSNAGHVRVFQYNGSAWVQLGADIDGETAGDNSGFSLSLSADGLTVAIGAPFNDGNGADSGHVRVYNYNGSAWVQVGSDIDGEAASDQSGRSVSISADGSTVVIGAPYNDFNNLGHVRVYQFNGSNWVQLGADIDGEATNDLSGQATSINADGSIVAIGVQYNDGNGMEAGHVRVYKYIGGTWVQQGADIDGEASPDFSGSSVSLSYDGLTVAIGAHQNDGNGGNSGHVRVYKYNGSAWVLQGTDIDGEQADDFSGRAVSLNAAGTKVAIGASQNDGSGIDAGHVRVYCFPSSSIDTLIACDSYTWIDGNTYTSSNNTATHTIAGGAANGCDSIVTLNLTIKNSSTVTDTQIACESYTWMDGNTYTSSNTTATYIIAGGAANGCDSIITLNLTINNASTGTDTQTACDSYTWIDGNTYTSNNTTATHTIVGGAANGCDSIVTLNLSIITVDTTVTTATNSITANAVNANFQWIDCSNNDSIIPGATDSTYTITESGSYAVIVTQNGCTDTSDCVNMTFLSSNALNQMTDLIIYPNPTSGNVTLSFGKGLDNGLVTIRNIFGQEVLVKQLSSEHLVDLTLNVPAGIYFVEIASGSGKIIATKKLVVK